MSLETWVNTELSRILPELGEAPAPIESEQGKLRFYQAISQAFQVVVNANRHLCVLLYDDAQFTDTASSEATRFVIEQLNFETRAQVRIVYGYRKGELSPALQERVNQSLVSGEGVLIELEPLDTEALGHLLENQSVTNFVKSDLAGIAATLQRFTGGNPLFVLETLKALTESQHAGPLTAQALETMQSSGGLPRSAKVNRVITRRLERLSKPAKDLVRVAAVMGQEYTLERAAKVLEANQIHLAEASEELEVNGFVRQDRFTHDLLYETALGEIPRSAKVLLHSRVVDLLVGIEAPAATIVNHAIAAEQLVNIFRYSILAARKAIKVWALQEAKEYLEYPHHLILDNAVFVKLKDEFGLEGIKKFFHVLTNVYTWSFDFIQVKTIWDEYLHLIRLHCSLEEECVILSQYGDFSHGNNTFSPHEIIRFCNQSVEIAERIGRDDLLAFSYSSLSETTNFLSHLFTDSISQKNTSIKLAEKALFHARNFLELNEKPHPLIAEVNTATGMIVWCLQALSGTLESVNFFIEAEEKLEEAMYLDNDLEKSNKPFYRYWLAILKIRLGKINDAEYFGFEAVKFVNVWVHSRRYIAYIPLFSVYYQKGEYSNIQITLEALEDSTLEDDAKCLFREYEGLLDFSNGAFSDARDTWLTGLTYDEQFFQSQKYAFFESALCAACFMLGDYTQALEYAQKAIANRDYRTLPRVESCDHWHFETMTLLQTGELDLARAEIQARAPHVEKWHRYRLPHLRSEAVLESFEGRHDTALEKLQQALAIAREIGIPPQIWEIEANIAHLLERQGDTENAALARSRAVAVRDSLAANIPDETMRQTYLDFTQRQIDVPIWEW